MPRLLYLFLPFTFILLAASSVSSKPSVLIDSLFGKAEIQRAGKYDWQYTKKGERLYSNDVIRVTNKSMAILKWPDGSKSFIHKNSQVLVNILQKNPGDNILSHATIFFGAVYFVVKKVIPQEIISEMRVYTPTAVISLRGTSFEVNVDPQNENTGVRVTNGIVQLRNMHKNASIFLSAPYKASVKKDTDPIIPRALLDSDLDSLKTWVPPKVIDNEITLQLSSSKRDRVAINRKTTDSCLFVPFTNSSKYTGKWDIGKILANVLADRIQGANSHLNIIMVDSPVYDPVQAGIDHNAGYVIKGTIETFDILQHAEISTSADEYREKSIARVKLLIKIIDTKDGGILSEESITGEIIQKNDQKNTWKSVETLEFDFDNNEFANSIIGLAALQAIEQAAEKLIRKFNFE